LIQIWPKCPKEVSEVRAEAAAAVVSEA